MSRPGHFNIIVLPRRATLGWNDASMLPTIAIVSGTGAEGFGLASRFARAGARVIVGSRDQAKAEEAARRIGNAEGKINTDAVAAADVVILTVPLTAQIATLKSIKS